MSAPVLRFDEALRSILLVGDYGSGKTEVAVNFALAAASAGRGPVTIVDLDLVNPYFRCREAREPLEAAGVRVVMPAGGHAFADLPILLPEVKGVMQADAGLSLLDVGGDEVGSRVLAGLSEVIRPGRHAVWFVVNARRPFNDTVEGCLKTIRRIEAASKLRVTGLVSNTHLMDETTPAMVNEGLRLAASVAALLGVPLQLVALMEPLGAETWTGLELEGTPLLLMRRLMVPPWVRREARPATGPAALRPPRSGMIDRQ